MKVRDIMTTKVVRIGAMEPVEVAARTFIHYNIGMLPVCGEDGRLCGVVTDRDLVIRCMARGRGGAEAKVRDVMTGRIISAGPDMDISAAAHLMGRQQVRRLPVVENGRLCGMVTLADLAAVEEGALTAADALVDITSNICKNNGKN
jgi:CBS domain-containing protein